MFDTILTIILFLIILYIAYYFFNKKKRSAKQLEKKYFMISGMPENIAKKTLERQKESLREKHPEKTEQWYMEKILFDLEKDKN